MATKKGNHLGTDRNSTTTSQSILPRFRYKDPGNPKFFENRNPIKCRLCGHVFRKAGYLWSTGECKGEIGCENRQRWNEAHGVGEWS